MSESATSTAAATSGATDLEQLFLSGRGSFGRQLERIGLASGGHLRPARAALAVIAVTWLPLLVLSTIEGLAWGGADVPFLRDFLAYCQFLIAVPVLVVGSIGAGRRLVDIAQELRESELLDRGADGRDLPSLLPPAAAGLGSRSTLVITVVSLAAIGLSLLEARDWLAGGWQYDDRITLAGWWYLLVSLPLLRLMTLLWLWRFVLWAWVLWRVSRLPIALRTIHPDRAGGLGFLGEAQIAFSPLLFAFGVQLSGLMTDQVVYRGTPALDFRSHVTAFVVLASFLSIAPLLVFVPTLAAARRASLRRLGSRAYRGARNLEHLLFDQGRDELPTDQISGLADYSPLYENALRLRYLPLEHRTALSLLLAAATPFTPLVFLIMPAQELVRTLAELLI